MSEARLQLPPHLLPAIQDKVLGVADSLAGKTAVIPHLPEDDEEGRQLWVESLKESLREDLDELQDILKASMQANGLLRVNDKQLDKLLRGCAAIRLNLRQTWLAEISDEALETGEGFDPDALSPETERAFAAFSILAGLQELLIATLDDEEGEED